MSTVRSFWAYVRERERIRVRRESGKPAPWTSDPTLASHSFSNVRRGDDPDNVRSIALISKGARTPHDYLWRAYAVRALNRLETFEKYGLPRPLEFRRWRATLDAAARRGESIGSPQHLTFWAHARLALPRITTALARLVHNADTGITAIRLLAAHRPTLYVGPYLGTLIIRDLAASAWGGAFGPDTQVPVANGARVGLEIATGELTPRQAHLLLAEKGRPSRRARSLPEATKPEILARVAKLAAQSEARSPLRLSFIDVENCLCEYSRYARVAAGLTGAWQRRIKR